MIALNIHHVTAVELVSVYRLPRVQTEGSLMDANYLREFFRVLRAMQVFTLEDAEIIPLGMQWRGVWEKFNAELADIAEKASDADLTKLAPGYYSEARHG